MTSTPDKKNRTTPDQRGAAMLLALGFLTIFLLIGVAFAYTSIMRSKSASASADQTKGKLLAESALDRARTALSMMADEDLDEDGELDSGEDRDGDNHLDRGFYPGNMFYRPQSSSDPWYGRSYHPSISTDTARIEHGLGHYVTAGDGRRLAFTPFEQPVHPGAGWVPVSSRTSGQSVEKLVGRMCYVMMDQSGMIHPGSSHIDLTALGFSSAFASELRSGDWHSLQHLAGATDPDAQQWQTMRNAFNVHTVRTRGYWRDLNDNGDWDEGGKRRLKPIGSKE